MHSNKIQNQSKKAFSLIAAFTSLISIPEVCAQGSLNPPAGVPGPTMKTLDQIESRTPISSIPFTISEPGSYYLTNNVKNDTTNADGITIDSDNVTLDLNGFTIIGSGMTEARIDSSWGTDSNQAPSLTAEEAAYGSGPNSDDGIVVLGSHINITIKNGNVIGWGGDAINGLNVDNALFLNLHVAFSNGDGIVTDFACIIENCTAYAVGLDGLETDDGSVIRGSTARQCGDNGIQTSEGCTVMSCSSFDNGTDGIDVAAGSVIQNCSATDNLVFGFDIALGGQATACVAYDNGSGSSTTVINPIGTPPEPQTNVPSRHGFDMASACILRDCIASLNNGHGVRTFANSFIIDCKLHENDHDGIRISSTDVEVRNCNTTDNDAFGIAVTSSGCFITGNRCAGNLHNYSITTTSSFGPIIDVTGVGDLSAIAGADHPLANFSY